MGVDYYIHDYPVKHPEKKLLIDTSEPYITKNIDNINGKSQSSKLNPTNTFPSLYNSPLPVSVKKRQQKCK